MTKINVDKLRSKFEAEVLKGIQSFKRRLRFDVEYESESINYITEQTYTPDFVVTLDDGRKIYLEAKGYWDATDRRKLKAVKTQHPDLDIRMIFQRDNKIHKNSNTKYSDYCARHNILFTVGEIPKEWFI